MEGLCDRRNGCEPIGNAAPREDLAPASSHAWAINLSIIESSLATPNWRTALMWRRCSIAAPARLHETCGFEREVCGGAAHGEADFCGTTGCVGGLRITGCETDKSGEEAKRQVWHGHTQGAEHDNGLDNSSVLGPGERPRPTQAVGRRHKPFLR